MTASPLIPVLEIGGTHVTSALVETPPGRVVAGSRRRRTLRPDAPADETLGRILACADGLSASPGAPWGVAVPGPFDYERGIALFEDVAKFDALYGVDLGQFLRDEVAARPAKVTFLNDATAFLLGEWTAGAATGHHRAVGITLGTGVGSAFLADGSVVDSGPDVPPGGRADLLSVRQRPLEDIVSRRAIISAFAATAAAAESDQDVDVQEIADRARSGEIAPRAVLEDAFVVLGEVLAPWLDRFRATTMVVGGAMTGSWDLIEGPLRLGLDKYSPDIAARCRPAMALHPDEAAMLGAAWRVTATPEGAQERGSH
jgi:glucokinase